MAVLENISLITSHQNIAFHSQWPCHHNHSSVHDLCHKPMQAEMCREHTLHEFSKQRESDNEEDGCSAMVEDATEAITDVKRFAVQHSLMHSF